VAGAADTISEPLGESDEVMRYAGEYHVPIWLAGLYLGSNILLNTLNFYWFAKMVETVRSRFREPRDKKGRKEESEGVMFEGLEDNSTIIDALLDGNVAAVVEEKGDGVAISKVGVDRRGKTMIEVEQKEVRRRKG